MDPFLKGSWRFPGAVLGAFLAVLGLSWEAWCSKNTIKSNRKRMFSNMFVFPILALLECTHLGSFWAVFDPKMGAKIQQKVVQQIIQFLVTFLTSFGSILESILGSKIG